MLKKLIQEARVLLGTLSPELVKFNKVITKAGALTDAFPSLIQTWAKQDHGYKGRDPVKAAATKKKILDKAGEALLGFQQGAEMAQKFAKDFDPASDQKKQTFDGDFAIWMKRYLEALDSAKKVVKDAGNVYFPPRLFDEPPFRDLRNTSNSVYMYWEMLQRPDPLPVSFKPGASDEERFLAFLDEDIRNLAKSIAKKIKKDPAKAAALVWLVLEDVNAHTEASRAESILSPLVPNGVADGVQDMVGSISGALEWGIVKAGAFGVALMQEVGEKGYADSLAKALAKDFAEYTTKD